MRNILKIISVILTFHILVQVITVQVCVFSDDGLSKCGDIPHDILQCSSQGNVSVLDCHCITYNENVKESQAEIGNCVYM